MEAVGEAGHAVAADCTQEKLGKARETLEQGGSHYSTRLVPSTPEAIELGDGGFYSRLAG